MPKKLSRLAISALFAIFALPSQAETWNYYFGDWIGGGPGYQPRSVFAHLSVESLNYQSFNFTLSAFNPTGAGTLAGAFGNNAVITKAVFNSISGDDPVNISNVQSNGFVGMVLGGQDIALGGVTFDFYDGFSGCNGVGCGGQVQSGEWVSWTLDFARAQNPFLSAPPVALRVQGFDENGVTSGWYTPISAVPEPETYAMLLGGLALLGIQTRRRRKSQPVQQAS